MEILNILSLKAVNPRGQHKLRLITFTIGVKEVHMRLSTVDGNRIMVCIKTYNLMEATMEAHYRPVLK